MLQVRESGPGIDGHKLPISRPLPGTCQWRKDSEGNIFLTCNYDCSKNSLVFSNGQNCIYAFVLSFYKITLCLSSPDTLCVMYHLGESILQGKQKPHWQPRRSNTKAFLLNVGWSLLCEIKRNFG